MLLLICSVVIFYVIRDLKRSKQKTSESEIVEELKKLNETIREESPVENKKSAEPPCSSKEN